MKETVSRALHQPFDWRAMAIGWATVELSGIALGVGVALLGITISLSGVLSTDAQDLLWGSKLWSVTGFLICLLPPFAGGWMTAANRHGSAVAEAATVAVLSLITGFAVWGLEPCSLRWSDCLYYFAHLPAVLSGVMLHDRVHSSTVG